MNPDTAKRIQDGRRKGGMTRTPARAAASRANGAKGGRPRLTVKDKAQIMAEYRQRGATR